LEYVTGVRNDPGKTPPAEAATAHA
jgi:hypothetical protein